MWHALLSPVAFIPFLDPATYLFRFRFRDVLGWGDDMFVCAVFVEEDLFDGEVLVQDDVLGWEGTTLYKKAVWAWRCIGLRAWHVCVKRHCFVRRHVCLRRRCFARRHVGVRRRCFARRHVCARRRCFARRHVCVRRLVSLSRLVCAIWHVWMWSCYLRYHISLNRKCRKPILSKKSGSLCSWTHLRLHLTYIFFARVFSRDRLLESWCVPTTTFRLANKSSLFVGRLGQTEQHVWEAQGEVLHRSALVTRAGSTGQKGQSLLPTPAGEGKDGKSGSTSSSPPIEGTCSELPISRVGWSSTVSDLSEARDWEAATMLSWNWKASTWSNTVSATTLIPDFFLFRTFCSYISQKFLITLQALQQKHWVILNHLSQHGWHSSSGWSIPEHLHLKKDLL